MSASADGALTLPLRGLVRRGHGLDAGHAKQPPLASDAVEDMGPSLTERYGRAKHKIAHCLGDEHLASLGDARQASSDPNRDPADFIAGHLALAAVHTGPKAVVRAVDDRRGAADGPPRVHRRRQGCRDDPGSRPVPETDRPPGR